MVENKNSGGFLLRKKQAIRSSAVAPAASLAVKSSDFTLSPVAAFGAPTILATTSGRGKPCAFSRTRKKGTDLVIRNKWRTL